MKFLGIFIDMSNLKIPRNFIDITQQSRAEFDNFYLAGQGSTLMGNANFGSDKKLHPQHDAAAAAAAALLAATAVAAAAVEN